MSLKVVNENAGTKQKASWRVKHVASDKFIDIGHFASAKKAKEWLDIILPLADWSKSAAEMLEANPSLLCQLRELANVNRG